MFSQTYAHVWDGRKKKPTTKSNKKWFVRYFVLDKVNVLLSRSLHFLIFFIYWFLLFWVEGGNKWNRWVSFIIFTCIEHNYTVRCIEIKHLSWTSLDCWWLWLNQNYILMHNWYQLEQRNADDLSHNAPYSVVIAIH